MLDDNELVKKVSKALSEPGEPLDKLGMGLGLQELMSKVWEKDGFDSGYISAYLLYKSSDALEDF